MIKHLLRTSLLMALPAMMATQSVAAGNAQISFKSQAPEGTELRIYSLPYGSATISGAQSSGLFGIYKAPAPGTTITMTGSIDQLEVFGNQISELTITSAPDMYILRCYDNQISSLDVSGAPKLVILDCKANRLTTLDVTACPLLEELNASANELTSVSLGTQSAMKTLDVSGNNLVLLNLKECPAVEDLSVQNNKFSELDLSANTKLWWLNVYGNELAGEAMENFIAKLPEGAQAPSMLYVVDTRADAEGNVCLVKDVQAAREKGWVCMDYAGGLDSGSMIGSFYYGADYVPVVSERVITLTTAKAVGQKITLTISASGDVVMKGVAESAPYTGTNTYTLTSQTVEVAGNVSTFGCASSEVTALSFAGSPVLTELDCRDNKLEELALTDAGSLQRLYVQNNALKSLNVEGCPALLGVYCYGNALKGNAMKRFMQSLRDGGSEKPVLFVIDTKDASEKNVATTTDVAIATAKGWEVKDYIGGDRYGMGTKYEGSEPTGPEIPEEYFTITTMESNVMFTVLFSDPEYTPVVEDCELSGWNGQTLTLRVTPGKAATIYGDATEILAPFARISAVNVAALPNLTSVNLGLNDLTTLDLSANKRLEALSVEGNDLAALELSGCPGLNYLNCYGNNISGQAMDAMVASLPGRVGKPAGSLIVFDPNYERERNKCLKSNVATARALNWDVYALNADMEPEEYEGADAVGLDNVTASPAGTTEVFNLSGVKVAEFDESSSVRGAGLPAGIYIVRTPGAKPRAVSVRP